MAIQYYKNENRPHVFIQIWESGTMKTSKPISVEKDHKNWVKTLRREISPKTKILALAGTCPVFTSQVEEVISLIQNMNK